MSEPVVFGFGRREQGTPTEPPNLRTKSRRNEENPRPITPEQAEEPDASYQATASFMSCSTSGRNSTRHFIRQNGSASSLSFPQARWLNSDSADVRSDAFPPRNRLLPKDRVHPARSARRISNCRSKTVNAGNSCKTSAILMAKKPSPSPRRCQPEKVEFPRRVGISSSLALVPCWVQAISFQNSP